jgi:outer membrane protein assembly factor BamB
VADGVVLLASGEHNGMVKSGGGGTRDDTLTAVDARTGKTLWQAKHPPSGYSSPENVFVIDGVVWCDHSSNGRSDGTVVGYDLKSGKERHRFAADQKSYWFHHRCYPGRATSEYLLTSRTGIEFVNLDSEKWDLNHWVRGPCLYGIMACNGLVYAGPSPCACYAEAYLHNFNALKASGGELLPAAGNRLEKGPAYSEVGSSEAAGDWPTYRGTNARSGSTKTTVPKTLTQRWATKLEGKLSSITAADGKLFVAQVDHHTVHAIDADTGKKQWHYTVGGRVDSPPTWFEGLLLFGSADGFVYCLNADTGELAWRFLAAKADRRILAFEQVESLWPVHGSILVRDGVAHFVAGRSIFVDGGMVFYRLDAKTGTIVSETILDDRNPATGKDAHELIQWLNMPVGRPDILSCDDERIYMRSQAFDLSGQRLRVGPHAHGSKEGSIQGGDETHLFCPTGFLDDTWFHRTYWLYGSTWGSGWCGYYVAGQHAPAGKMICVGDDEVFVFGRQPQYYKWTTPLEYRLFSSKKIWQKNPNPNPVTDKEKRRGGGSQPVTYQGNYNWITHVPVLVRAMVLADRTLFLAGPKDILDESKAGLMGGEPGARQEAAFLGKEGAVLWAVSADDGEKVAECQLASPPIFDGMIAADGRLYLSTIAGEIVCLGEAD